MDDKMITIFFVDASSVSRRLDDMLGAFRTGCV